MIIDGHCHIEKEYDQIIESMDSVGIDKTILLGVGLSDLKLVTIKDSPIFRSDLLLKILGPLKAKMIVKSKSFKKAVLDIPRNDDVLRAIKERPDRFLGFSFIHPDKENVLDEIERCFNGGMVGIKMALLQFPTDLSGKKMMAICEYAKDKDAPIFLHQGITKESCDMTRMLQSFPKNKFIIAHAGVQRFEDAIASAKKYENVFIDTSSYIVTKSKILTMHKELGAGKIIFGSDVPVMAKSQKEAFDKIMNLSITDEDKRKIVGENLKSILNL